MINQEDENFDLEEYPRVTIKMFDNIIEYIPKTELPLIEWKCESPIIFFESFES